VVLAQRLRDALVRLNPGLPAEAPDDAFRKLARPGVEKSGADLMVNQFRVIEGLCELRGFSGVLSL
jgi:hypothetical protein